MKSEELNTIREWFDAYVQTFAINNENMHPLLQLKIDHSRRVAKDAESLANDLEWSFSDVNTAEALGWLHDVGRFQQFAEYQTFSDAVSIDHGQYGQAVVSDTQILDSLTSEERKHILDGILYHNAKNMPGDLTPSSLPFLKLIRDADKLDIFLVVLEAIETDGFRDLLIMLPNVTLNRSCSPEIVQEIQNHRCCSYGNVRSLGDLLVMQLSWVFDLNYKPTFRHFSHRRIMSRILQQLPVNSHTKNIGTMVEEFVDDRLNNIQISRPSEKAIP